MTVFHFTGKTGYKILVTVKKRNVFFLNESIQLV